MANSGKRKGSKNSHQRSKFASHPPKADRNKKRRIEKDVKLKEKAKNKKRHRHIWHYIKEIAKLLFKQKCKVCLVERNKKSNKK